jgi:hypothetical protein
MIEIRQLIDDIRQAERELSTVANKATNRSLRLKRPARPLRNRSLKPGALSLTEQALSEAGQPLQLQGSKGHAARAKRE